jgi:hypothetical protein
MFEAKYTPGPHVHKESALKIHRNPPEPPYYRGEIHSAAPGNRTALGWVDNRSLSIEENWHNAQLFSTADELLKSCSLLIQRIYDLERYLQESYVAEFGEVSDMNSLRLMTTAHAVPYAELVVAKALGLNREDE